MRVRILAGLPILLAAVVAALLALASPALAHGHKAKSVHLEGGQTALTLDRGTAKVLADNKVKVAPIDGAKASGRTLSFPIVGGKVDAETLAGKIEHSGGIRFSAGDKKLSVEDFVIDTKKGVLTARVSGTDTRVPLLKLDLSDADIDRGDNQVVIGNVQATLTSEAAAALNKTFGVKLFKKGLKIGVAKVTAKF